jgi:hypothetical protein
LLLHPREQRDRVRVDLEYLQGPGGDAGIGARPSRIGRPQAFRLCQLFLRLRRKRKNALCGCIR